MLAVFFAIGLLIGAAFRALRRSKWELVNQLGAIGSGLSATLAGIVVLLGLSQWRATGDAQMNAAIAVYGVLAGTLMVVVLAMLVGVLQSRILARPFWQVTRSAIPEVIAVTLLSLYCTRWLPTPPINTQGSAWTADQQARYDETRRLYEAIPDEYKRVSVEEIDAWAKQTTNSRGKRDPLVPPEAEQAIRHYAAALRQPAIQTKPRGMMSAAAAARWSLALGWGVGALLGIFGRRSATSTAK